MVLFWVVFGLFLAGITVWAVMTLRWAIRRNRQLKMSQSGAELSE
jgi:hypothetical protein